MSGTDYDLIIIGAGINGAGVARDAAMRGLNVLLLDKGDMSSGTSSWSTRLIHGGLRYLEHGEVLLVRESLRERETLLRIAPHLVKPLPILIPIYSEGQRGSWTIRAGMIAYDLLSYDKTFPRHRGLSRSEALKSVPTLNDIGLESAVIYYDAQAEFAERLVVENVLCARDHGATVQTYTEVVEFTVRDGQVTGVTVKNTLTGQSREVSGRLIINASGPWVDQVLEQSGISSRSLIGGTKGSHLIVAPFPGAPDISLYTEAQKDQRPIFVIPWNHKYLIGTTDIRYHGSLDRVDIDEVEIDYLLAETNRLIPSARLTRESILFTYSGVRPLAFTKAQDEQSITRRHFIYEDEVIPNLFSLVGGKLTTYRRLAEQTVDLCVRRLRKRARECLTASIPLPGAWRPRSDGLEKAFNISAETVARLKNIYGRRSREILELIRLDNQLQEIFDEESGAIAAEIVFAIRNEMAQTLADCLLRRTLVGLNSTCGLNAIEAAGKIAQRKLGWSAERANEEIERYREYVQRFHCKRPEP